MSSICLFAAKGITAEKKKKYIHDIQKLVIDYKRGVKFFIAWSESMVLDIQKDSFIVNIVDSPKSDNCEMFLLPDGWFCNGKTAQLPFKSRMRLLEKIALLFEENVDDVELYIGQSGSQPEELLNVVIKGHELADYLSKTIGIYGADEGLHICITS